MRRFEDDLRRAMGRVEPPLGFAERVLARARQQEAARQPKHSVWYSPFMRMAAAAAFVAAVTVGGLQYQRYREGIEAKEKVMFAMQLAGGKLHSVQSRVLSLNERRSETRYTGTSPREIEQ